MIRNIKTEELKKMIDSGESFVIVNVLDAEDYDLEHICGSINIPVAKVSEEAPKVINKFEKVIVHCSGPSCKASAAAAEKLDKLGYSDVMRYEGGIEEWKAAGYCLEGEAYKEAAA